MSTQAPIADWSQYAALVREYDAVLEHARAVSAAVVGIATKAPHLHYGEQIFVKLLAHAFTLRQLAPDPHRKRQNELWDLPSMSAVARCAIEAHDAFVYITLGDISPEERAFRLSLWALHDLTRRATMQDATGSRDPLIENVDAEIARLRQDVQASPYYVTRLTATDRKKVERDNPPAYYLSERKRCEIYGVNHDYYKAVDMQLSQHVHTFPFAVRQLFHFRAGGAEALVMMSLPLRCVLPFLARVTDDMRSLFHGRAPAPPSRTARVMALWRGVAARGLKD